MVLIVGVQLHPKGIEDPLGVEGREGVEVRTPTYIAADSPRREALLQDIVGGKGRCGI
jgi:hypothetical protein